MSFWAAVVGVLVPALAALATGHVLLHKRDSRSATAWVGIIWLVPVVGAALYGLFGINRIRRKALSLRPVPAPPADAVLVAGDGPALHDRLGPEFGHMAALALLGDRVLRRPLTAGNRVTPLRDGDQAFPAMLEAMSAATRSITLATYIFDRDPVGRRFLEALAEAADRGVEVRVLVDAIGALYSLPPMTRDLRAAGVRCATFLPPRLPAGVPFLNLRSHRKLLVTDGRVGFAGGLNVRAGHVLADDPPAPARDLHFQLGGPVVGQLQTIFAEDWTFTTGELLQGEAWFPALEEDGPTIARGISDGPDIDFEKLRWVMLGALGAAQRSVRVMTPYFLPDAALATALDLAALRGVRVDIVLPERSNLPWVDWASAAQWGQLLGRGCRLWLTPPPFDHAKLLTVDGVWCLVGSANWDPRSLRLNFELGVEVYDALLVRKLDEFVAGRMREARRVTLSDWASRSLPVRLRDGAARLLAPYL